MRLIPRVSLRSVLRAAPACSSGAVFSEQERMEQWNSREGVGNRDAISLLGILSSGLLPILIASLFPSRPCFRPPIIRLETSFGGGKTHNLIAVLHVCRGGIELRVITRFVSPELLPEQPIQKRLFRCSGRLVLGGSP